MNTKFYALSLIVTFFLLLSCKKDSAIISSGGQPEIYSKSLSGKVILENQTEHSNALIYIDHLDIGTSSDTLGYFAFQFSDDDSVYSGIFTVYYYLADYDLDSSKFALEKGKVINDSLDVGSDGRLMSKHLKQLMLVNGATDKSEYEVGNTLLFTARITNCSESTIYIRIFNGIQVLANVFLYNDKYPSFFLTPIIGVPAEAYLTLYKNETYQETRHFIVPEGRYLNNDLYPIPTDEYIVVASNFEIIRVNKTILKKINKFRRNWYKICQGTSPKIDYIPNKYEYPHVVINN